MSVRELVPVLFLGQHNSGSSITVKIGEKDYNIKRKDRAYIDDILLMGVGDYLVDTLKTTAPMQYIICVKTAPVTKGEYCHE